MDDRAWEFLLNAPGHTQEVHWILRSILCSIASRVALSVQVVIKDFKPRRFDDGDYSAAARGLSVIGGAIGASNRCGRRHLLHMLLAAYALMEEEKLIDWLKRSKRI